MKKAAAALVILAVALVALPLSHWGSDFRSFYTGARLAGTPELFSLDAMRKIEAPLGTDLSQLQVWIRPPFYALLLLPLGQLPYRAAACIWQVILALALVLFVRFWDDQEPSYWMAALFLPMLLALYFGQDVALLLLLAAIAVRLEQRGNSFIAGLVLSLCAIKPHLFLLAPLWMASRRMWRMGLGLGVGGGILAAVCFGVNGRDWLFRYHDVVAVNELHQVSKEYVSLAGLLHSAPAICWWPAALLVAAVFWYAQRRMEKQDAFAFALFGGLLIAPHAFLYDLGFLLPYFLRRRNAAIAVVLLCVLFKLPSAFPAQLGLVLLFLFGAVQANSEASIARLAGWTKPAGRPLPAARP